MKIENNINDYPFPFDDIQPQNQTAFYMPGSRENYGKEK